ncbi:MAG: hypothetical protein JXA79_08730 [Deltaproteobacteria bacterium]|nr:hypothetical protein [Deltaproteobacteria bacterium]
MNSLRTAQIENEMGITGTYYFRMVQQSFDEEVIRQIAGLGHEIGYHYEDLSRCAARGVRYAAENKVPLPGGVRGGLKGLQDRKTARLQDKVLTEDKLAEMAISSFSKNLEKLRRVVPVETICMHGSPLSKWDNRLLWKYYDYRDLGITGEPYFDLDFNDVLYLSDTGRRWDGEAVSIRDKVQERNRGGEGEKGREGEEEIIKEVIESGTCSNRNETSENTVAPSPLSPLDPSLSYKLHSTFDIINAAKGKKLPDKIMMTIHPQRWDNQPLTWLKELLWQNFKNVGKRMIVGSQK